jgi:protein-S-isoprenylcysteine O-methyltransferase Ste14
MLQAWFGLKTPVYSLIVLGCWVIFLGYWLATAFTNKKTAERRSFLSSLSYRLPIVVGVIVIVAMGRHYPMYVKLTPDTIYTRWAGAFVCVAGLVFSIWSRHVLGRNWSSNITFKEGHQLIRTGPYRFVRHPIYTGILVMSSGPAIQYGRVFSWFALLVIGVGLWIKLKQEESVMLKHFPEYSEYRKQVSALVPFII